MANSLLLLETLNSRGIVLLDGETHKSCALPQLITVRLPVYGSYASKISTQVVANTALKVKWKQFNDYTIHGLVVFFSICGNYYY